MAVRFRYKSAVLASLSLPCIIGSALLYTLPRNTKGQQVGNLISYYLLSSLFAGNPLIVSWLVACSGGHTKRSAMVSMYNAGASVGNIVGPLLFKAADAPRYKPGLKAVMGLFIAQAGLVGFMVLGFIALNRKKANQREAMGKPRVIIDRSMEKRIGTHVENVDLEAVHESQKGRNPLTNQDKDISDWKNEEVRFSFATRTTSRASTDDRPVVPYSSSTSFERCPPPRPSSALCPLLALVSITMFSFLYLGLILASPCTRPTCRPRLIDRMLCLPPFSAMRVCIAWLR
jgi:MFS family permease